MHDIWLHKLAKLRVDRASKNPAPHKPLLLLALLDQIENGEITTPIVHLTSELAFRFLGYWEIVATRGRAVGRVELPFFYLKSDGFLQHVAHPGLEAALDSIKPTSVELINRVIDHAAIPDDFFALMQEKTYRNAARNILINGDWFTSNEKQNLRAVLGLNESSESLEMHPAAHVSETVKGRDVRFRFQIVPLYHYACILCGIKLLLPSGTTLVEAAHIHPYAHSRNNDVTNGMALCRNHHWAFDQGLWTIDLEYEVIVSRQPFLEDAPQQRRLSDFQGTYLDFSWLSEAQRPAMKNLEWHMKHRFISGR